MTNQLYVIAAVCLWLLSACQSSTYKYEAVYKDLPFVSNGVIPVHGFSVSGSAASSVRHARSRDDRIASRSTREV